jgi:hypothetical protein
VDEDGGIQAVAHDAAEGGVGAGLKELGVTDGGALFDRNSSPYPVWRRAETAR